MKFISRESGLIVLSLPCSYSPVKKRVFSRSASVEREANLSLDLKRYVASKVSLQAMFIISACLSSEHGGKKITFD